MRIDNQLRARFAIAYGVALCAMFCILLVLEQRFYIRSPGAVGIAIQIVATNYVGVKLGRRLGEIPPSGVLWRIAGEFVAIGLVFDAVLATLYVIFGLSPQDQYLLYLLVSHPTASFFAIAAMVLLVYLVATRLMLRGAIKAGTRANKQAA
ncbi:MAG: ABZJ_00895 family protein [Pseudomonadota bacterium]